MAKIAPDSQEHRLGRTKTVVLTLGYQGFGFDWWDGFCSKASLQGIGGVSVLLQLPILGDHPRIQ
jgi:hypothetical protein